jgi:hypothetical protein
MKLDKPKCPNCGEALPLWLTLSGRSSADRIFEHAGNHKLLKKANELIELARSYEEKVRELQKKHRKRLKSQYLHKVSVKVSDGSSWTKIPKGQEYITITAVLLNNGMFDNHLKLYGSLSQPPSEKYTTVKYYRKHGMLLHDSGGHHILEDEQPCSAEEWSELCAGRIPKKFMRG